MTRTAQLVLLDNATMSLRLAFSGITGSPGRSFSEAVDLFADAGIPMPDAFRVALASALRKEAT